MTMIGIYTNRPANSWRRFFLAGTIMAVIAFIMSVTGPVSAGECLDRWPCDVSWKTDAKPVHKSKHRRPMLIGRGVNSKLLSAYKYVGSRCKGVRIVSGVRKTLVSGTRRRSKHWAGNALDFKAGSYKCAYAALRSYGWKGGWSRDAKKCRHIHISFGGKRREPAGFRHRRC